MSLNPPKHICGSLKNVGKSAPINERREWIKAKTIEGYTRHQIAGALGVGVALVTGTSKRYEVAAPKVEPAKPRRNVRSVIVPSGSGASTVVSLPRSPWPEPDGRIASRPETDPDQRAPRRRLRFMPIKVDPVTRLRRVCEELIEQELSR